MMQFRKKLFPLIFLFFASSYTLFAQQPAYYETNATFRKGLELFDHNQFASAAEMFRQVYTDKQVAGSTPAENGDITMMKADARYYEILCGLELGNRQSQEALLSFITDYPESEKTKSAMFHVGKLYYARKDYPQAIEWFSKVKENDLAGNDRAEYNFKMGISHLETGEDIRALGFFKKAQQPRNPYTNDATYYYAHVSFLKKDYDVSLREFEKLRDVPQYKDAYIYYKSQILLVLDKVDAAIALAEPAFENGRGSEYEAQLAKLLGSAYFNKGEYEKAVEYFGFFLNSTHAADQSSQDSYQIGYSYYKTGDYKNAIILLEPLVNGDDIWTQYAMYTLGDCFLKTDNKQNARAAFERASKLAHDEEIQQHALLQYAKLSYELGFNSFALTATQQYIERFPNSVYIDEARTVRGEVLLSSRNYAEALKVLESVRNKTRQSNELYQKVSYYRGAELFNEKKYEQAIELFKQAVYYSEDRNITALANYWAGEAYYELRYFSEAVANYRAFFANERAASTNVMPFAYYTAGYAYFQNDDFRQAAQHFQQYISSGGSEQGVINDARLRLADSRFVLKNYGQALDVYNSVIASGGSGVDYALYQKGMIEGLRGQNANKAGTLQGIISKYPESGYADDAQFEIGNTYLLEGNVAQATAEFNSLISRYPNSSRAPEAMMKLGLIQYNAGNDEAALATYKKVVSNYGSTAQRREAIQAIRNIYVEQGNAEAFLSYSKTVPNVNISTSEQDSISYQAAYSMYLKGDCEKGVATFSNYLSNFPQGQFTNDVHFYRAECLVRSNKHDEALSDFLYLAEQPKNQYSQRALVAASEIYITREDFVNVLPLLKTLEGDPEYQENQGFAIVNLMRAYNAQGNADSTFYYSQEVLKNEKASTNELNMAHLYAGKSYLARGEAARALEEFRAASKTAKTAVAAEAKYLEAQIQNTSGDYDASEKSCFEVINNMPNQDYWVARSFVLLADNYAKKGNIFQARSTLQSVIDNYQGDDDIVPSAKQKLEEINAADKAEEAAQDSTSNEN
ncbi:tol-pal system protein YbgF [Anseongella ginsenosidimutans]|uniref:Tol-pal system protein YbgF n=1 Tax=Anseongella ginsenosidimutans TaxID=496056 RepID=A0A4R3KNT9_9SPHI|nr:tetratricopeptide repeat protein [Anseongella ginsenosidimutans]QEC52732.1 tetratricopeptide repeat protein [Anseongella ginsenosidimutans]TCS85486.1 tol-pal system protein YbgF [Anseongella ginsenosidimutans]